MTSPRHALPDDVVPLTSISDEAVAVRPRRAAIDEVMDEIDDLAPVVVLPMRALVDQDEKRRRLFRRRYIAPAVAVAAVAGIAGGAVVQPQAMGVEAAERPSVNVEAPAARTADAVSRSNDRPALAAATTKAASVKAPEAPAAKAAATKAPVAKAPAAKAEPAAEMKVMATKFTSDSVYLRPTPAVTKDKMTVLPAGEKVYVTGETQGNWSAVQYKERKGWVTTKFLSDQKPVAPAAVAAAPGQLARPANGPITSPYGMRVHPIFHVYRMHTGVDYGAACGSPLYAAGDGVVERSGWVSGYGNQLMLDMGRIDVSYAHAQSFTVHAGQRVVKGQVIGYVGSTGNSTGCHLHYEAFVNDQRVDPASLY